MCGRYVLAIPSEEIASYFDARYTPGAEAGYVPSYNIPPTAEVLALGEGEDGERILDLYRWGLVPPWSEHPISSPPMHNTRAESVATKPSFRAAFLKRRVAVVGEGYYEWRRLPGTRLQPFYITRTDGAPLVFASLFEQWWRDEHTIRSTAVVTTTAGEDVDAVHDRMPVVLEPDTLSIWLDRDEDDRETLESLLVPAPRGTLVARPVDPRVGKVAEDDAHLIEPVILAPEPTVEELTLF